MANKKEVCYYLVKVKEIMIMPDYILLDDMIDDMLDNVSYIKLNSHLVVDDDN